MAHSTLNSAVYKNITVHGSHPRLAIFEYLDDHSDHLVWDSLRLVHTSPMECDHCKRYRVLVHTTWDPIAHRPLANNFDCLLRHDRSKNCTENCHSAYLCYTCFAHWRRTFVRHLAYNLAELVYTENNLTCMSGPHQEVLAGVADDVSRSQFLSRVLDYIDHSDIKFNDIGINTAVCTACRYWKSQVCLEHPAPEKLDKWHPDWCHEAPAVCFAAHQHDEWQDVYSSCLVNNCSCSHDPYYCEANRCHYDDKQACKKLRRSTSLPAEDSAIAESNDLLFFADRCRDVLSKLAPVALDTSVPDLDRSLSSVGGVEPPPEERQTLQSLATNPAPTVETREIVQNDPDSIKSDPVAPSTKARRKALPIEEASITSIMKRSYIIDNNLTWSTTAAQFFPIYVAQFPSAFFPNTLAPTGLVYFHRFFRSDFRVQLRMNPSPYNAGILIMFLVPGDINPAIAGNPNTWTQYHHVFLKIGDETTCQLDIPWESSLRAITTSATAFNGVGMQLVLAVWSPLTAGTGAPTTLDLTLWAEAIEPMVAIKTLQGEAGEHAGWMKTLTDALPMISEAAKTVGGITGLFDTPPVPEETPESQKCANVPKRVVNTTWDYKFAVPPDSQFTIPPELSIITRCRKPTLAFTINWPTTATPGTVLSALPVSPGNGPLGGTPTSLAFFSSFFAYWRGSICMTFEIVGTKFHQGQLFIAWDPTGSLGAPNPAYFNCHGASMTIGQANNRLTLRVPYVATTDYLTMSGTLGSLALVIQNSLVAPTTVASAVSILVYVHAGPDYQLAVPTNPALNGITMIQQGLTLPGKQLLQGSTQGSDTAKNTFEEFSLVNDDLVETGWMGPADWDVRTLLRMPIWFLESSTTASNSTPVAFAVVSRMMPFNAQGDTTLGALANAWSYSSGGVRIHLLTSATKTTPIFVWLVTVPNQTIIPWTQTITPTPLALGHAWAARGGVKHLNSEPTVTLELPGYGAQPFAPCFTNNSLVTNPVSYPWGSAYVVLECQTTTTTVFQYTMGMSAGDDFTLYIPRNTPAPIPTTAKPTIESGIVTMEVAPMVSDKPRRRKKDKLFRHWKPRETAIDEPDGEVQTLQGDENVMTQVADLVKESVGLLKLIPDALKSVDALQKTLTAGWTKLTAILEVVLNDVFPLVTAVHTIAYGDTTMKAIALTSILNIVFRKLSRPDKLDKGMSRPLSTSTYYNADEMMDLPPRQTPDLMDCGDDAFEDDETTLKQVDQGLFDFDHSDIARQDPLTWLVTDGITHWINSICAGFGYFLPKGYKTYMRRCAGTHEGSGVKVGMPSSFSGVIRAIFHTILYIIHGNDLNEEYERSILSEVAKANAIYNKLAATNAFDYEKLDKAFGETTPREILKRLMDVVERIEPMLGELRSVPSYVGTFCTEIRKKQAAIHRLDNEAVMRPEPVCIGLFGPAGWGKSVLLTSLLPTIVLRTVGLYPAKDDMAVYTIPTGEKAGFWDGYDGQPWVNFDDFLQGNDAKDALEFIRVVNVAAMPIDKAHLDDKGRRFRSHFVGVTTNASSVQISNKAIIEPNAIARRLTHCYSLTLDRQYAKEEVSMGNGNTVAMTLDYSKMTKEMKVEQDAGRDPLAVLDKVWKFESINPLTGQKLANHPIYRFGDVVKSLAELHKTRTDNFAAGRDVLKQLLQGNWDDIETELDKMQRRMNSAATHATLDSEDDEDSFRDDKAAEFLFDMALFNGTYPDGTQTLLMKTLTTFKQVRDYSDKACTQVMNQIINYTEEELGFDYTQFHDLLKKKYGTPFQKMYGVKNMIGVPTATTHSMPAFGDYIWQHSNGYKKGGLLKKFTGILPLLAAGGATALFAIALIKKVSDFIKLGMQLMQGYAGKWAKAARVPNKPMLQRGHVQLPQGQDDDVTTVIRKGLREIAVVSDGGEGMATQCLCLDQKYLIAPKHLIDIHYKNKQNGHTTVVSVNVRGEYGQVTEFMPIVVGPENCIGLEYVDMLGNERKVDAVLIGLRTECIPRAKSIWHLVSDYQLHGMVDQCVAGRILNHTCRTTPGEDYDVTIRRFEENQNMNGISISATTARATGQGDCGLPYLIPSRFAKPIVGIHTWIVEGKGIVGAAPLCIQMLERAKKNMGLKVIAVEKEEFSVQTQQANNRYWNSNMELVGTGKFGNWQVSHWVPNNDKFARVKFRGVLVMPPHWDCDYEPAAQQVVGNVHPLFSNAQKYENTAVMSVNVLYHQHAVNHFSAKYEPQRCTRIFTLDEAINGVPPMQPVRTDTSSGYWVEFGFKQGKKDLLQPLPQEVDAQGQLEPVRYILSAKAHQHEVPMFGQTFVQRMEKVEEMGRRGIAGICPWTSQTKFELLKKAKVEMGKTRVFEQPGFEYTLLVRKYYGAFLNYYKERAGFVFYHGIGRDKEEVWGRYYEEMVRNSQYGVDFDFANYDGTVHQSAFQFFLDVVENYYKDSTQEERNMRAVLLDMLRETYIILGNQISYSIKGNKSGNPFTDVFNSITNTYMQYVAFMACVQGQSVNLQLFDDGVRMLTYGDDIIATVREDLLPLYNGQTVKSVLSSLGYRVTDAAKSAEMPLCRPLHELTFLKSPFVLRDGVCWAPLPLRDINKELKYCDAKWVGNEDDLRLRLLVTQKFMCHHGRDALQRFKADLMAQAGIRREDLSVDYDTERNRVAALQREAVIYG